MMFTMTIWLLLSAAFLFGFLWRGAIHRREVEELDELRAHHAALHHLAEAAGAPARGGTVSA